MTQLVVLFDKANLLSTADLWRLSLAMEVAGQHRAAAWGFEPPAIMVQRDEKRLPKGAMALVFVTGKDTNPGALADHYWDGTRGAPAGTCYFDRTSGFNLGSYSAAESASHELEALNNPRLNRWVQHPIRERAELDHELPLEDSDATQDTYTVDLPDPVTGKQVRWQLANFVFPSWFRAGAEGPYDYAGRLSRPGEIGPEGYTVVRGPREGGGREYWLEDATGARFGAVPTDGRKGAKAHALIAGRTQRLLAGG